MAIIVANAAAPVAIDSSSEQDRAIADASPFHARRAALDGMGPFRRDDAREPALLRRPASARRAFAHHPARHRLKRGRLRAGAIRLLRLLYDPEVLWDSFLDFIGLRKGMFAAMTIRAAASASHAWMSGFWGFSIARSVLGFGEGSAFRRR